MFAGEDGPYRAAVEPRRGPQAGKSGDPHSQNADKKARGRREMIIMGRLSM